MSYEALLGYNTLNLAQQVGLLDTGTERRLLARRLEAVGLEDTLEGLGRRSLASRPAAATRLLTTHGRHIVVSGRRDSSGEHFVLTLRQTFRMNAGTKKWSQL